MNIDCNHKYITVTCHLNTFKMLFKYQYINMQQTLLSFSIWNIAIFYSCIHVYNFINNFLIYEVFILAVEKIDNINLSCACKFFCPPYVHISCNCQNRLILTLLQIKNINFYSSFENALQKLSKNKKKLICTTIGGWHDIIKFFNTVFTYFLPQLLLLLLT